MRACLDAVAKQTVKPFEVIVVDNNSTDATAAIAKSYPFVTVLTESRQGPVYARNRGFDAAKGDVIGRIDVDTHLSAEWVATVQRLFSESDMGAVSGSIGYYDVPLKPLFERVDLFLRTHLARSLSRRSEVFLYGSNMAIRPQAWRALRDKVCYERAMHEDIDLAAHAAHGPHRVAFHPDLKAYVSGRRIDSRLGDFWPYVLRNGRTYAAHGLRGRFYMYGVQTAVVLFYPLLRLLYRGYDMKSGRFSFSRMFRGSGQERVSPVSESL